MPLSAQLLVIDPQIDFMDLPGSALPVPGGNEDMNRLAKMVDRLGGKLSDIHVTLDSHHTVDVGHPAMWRSATGRPPAPFTAIMAEDIRTGIWTPRNPNAKPSALGGETVKDYFIRYAQTLEDQGSYVLMVWPTHCLIGSRGHAVQPALQASLDRWAADQFATIDYVTKGTNPWTEHYGPLQAEVPMASDPSTQLNTGLLQTLQGTDILAIAGEALTHCLLGGLNQIVTNIDPKLVRKIHLLTDATSPIPAGPGTPDFPALAKKRLKELQAMGLVLSTTTTFLA